MHLGRELALIQRIDSREASGRVFDAGRPIAGLLPDPRYTPHRGTPGDLERDRLIYDLVEQDTHHFIRGAGLKASYGIFGAPGSGKTHLLEHLLSQLLSLGGSRPGEKFGALILDPKAQLLERVQSMAQAAGREEDIAVVSAEELRRTGRGLNVIDCAITPWELGRVLVLAAQAAGSRASDPFWFNAWSTVFSSTLLLLDLLDNDVVTLGRLTDVLLTSETDLAGNSQRKIIGLMEEALDEIQRRPRENSKDIELAIEQLRAFYASDYVSTIETFISDAYGAFQLSRQAIFSPAVTKSSQRTSLYDSIIKDQKIVVVSLSPGEPTLAKTLCTIVKCLFQQTVLSWSSRAREQGLPTSPGPTLIACDEYAEIASEVPGQPMGDGHFFSLAREFRCMGLLATQSVNMLQNSSLGDGWRAVFSTLGAKIFMRLSDNETAKEATELAAQSDWYVTGEGIQHSKDGAGLGKQRDLRERQALPTEVLTRTLRRGQAVVIGASDGGVDRSGLWFIEVPRQIGSAP